MIGLFLEEIDIGMKVALGQHTFARQAIVEFANQFDPQKFHLNEADAKAGPFAALSASGWHTAAGWMACFVATNSKARDTLQAAGKRLPEIGPSPGLTNLRWLAPVYVDDRLSYFTTVTHKRDLASRPNWGIVSAFNEGFNQHGKLVFSFEGAVLTAKRS